jgi:hypothetical protein
VPNDEEPAASRTPKNIDDNQCGIIFIYNGNTYLTTVNNNKISIMLSAKTKTSTATTMTPVIFTEGEDDMKQQQQLQELQTKIDDMTKSLSQK